MVLDGDGVVGELVLGLPERSKQDRNGSVRGLDEKKEKSNSPPSSLGDESGTLLGNEGGEDLVNGEDLQHQSSSRDANSVGEVDDGSIGTDGGGTSSTEERKERRQSAFVVRKQGR